MLSSMVVGTWTAFETLAGDLWEAAVNAHPRGLAKLVGGEHRGQKGKEDLGRMVPLERLEKHNYDVSRVMGTLERSLKKVRFAALEEIRGAYKVAFGAEVPTVCRILEDPAPHNLSTVRNLIVHKAQVCDQEYRDKSGGSTVLPQLALGAKLELDGAFVKQLTEPVAQCCVRLLQTIDAWLDNSLAVPEQGELEQGLGI